MYNAEKLQEYAGVIFDRLNQFNDFTLATIARRIKATGRLSAYDQQSLKNMADITGDMQRITKKLAEITKLNIDDLEKIYSQTVSDGINTYKPLYDFKNMPFLPFEQNDFAQRLVMHWAQQTAGEMINLSRTKALCFDRYNINGEVIGSTPLQGAFQEAIDSAVTAVSSGTTDFNTAMSKTIENLGGSGVRVNYASGVTRSLPAMIRQNLLYAVKQSAKSYDEYVGEQLDCDGFEVDAHPGCRPTHEVIQGQMFAYGDDDITIDGVTYLSANKDLGGGKSALELLDDYGCLHFTLSAILGVSVPRYSKEQLAEIDRQTKELIEYDGRKKTLYEWKQTARRMERAIRKKQTQANMFKEAGNNTKAKDFRDEATAYRIKYNDMCENVGLRPQLDRMQTYKKPLTNGDNSGIIKENRNITKRGMANGLRKTPTHILTDNEIKSLKEDIKTIKADESVFVFNTGICTSYVDKYDKIFVCGDVLSDFNSQHPRDLMSSRAVLAHEYYGHRAYRGTKLEPQSWNDEFRASYMAAKNCPNLTDKDRQYLVLDALERAKENGVTIKNNDFIRSLLYGY